MALKNLFDMVKADRYTQDGREAIIKAQEAETEDKVYQIGEISQKTGLQKTANGWVKPKNGKQPGAASKHDTDPQTYIVKKNDELRKMYLNEKDPAKKEAMKKALKKQASMMEPEPFSSTESNPAPKSLAGTPMKKADLNSKDPYEITHSMKPDTASEAKEMDKISAFMQEETGATLRNAITARESFYKNTKNPTPEQQEGLAALMKIQQKLGYGKPAEGPALNGQKKTVSHQEYRDGPMYGPAGSKPSADWKETPSGRTNMIRTPEGTATVTWNKEANGEEWYGFSTVKNNKMKSSDTHYKTKAEAQLAAEKELKGESKPTAGNNLSDIPDFKGMESGDYDNKLRAEGWTTGGWEGNGTHASAIFKKGDRTIRVNEGQPGKITSVQEISKPAAEGWEETRMASGKIYDLKSQGKRIIEQYDPETETKTFKLRDLNNARAPDKEFKSLEEAKNAATKSAEDSAPRVLTGDCRIRIRKEKPALTGDTKIRVRK